MILGRYSNYSYFHSLKFCFKIFCVNKFQTGITVQIYFQFIIIMKKNLIHVREHCVHLLKEKGSERRHGTIDITSSHLQLFTAADLSSPSHRVPLFTPRVRAPVLNILKYGEKFRWKKFP